MFVERRKNRINIYQKEYDPAAQAKLKVLPGASFRNASSRDSAHWTMPLSTRSLSKLRQAFPDLRIEPSLIDWARERAARDRQLLELGLSTGVELERLPRVLPALYRALWVGPRGKYMSEEELDDEWLGSEPSYQCADVAYLVRSPAPLNGLKPGLGKTLEYIGAVYEAGWEDGKHLIIAPATSIETVWREELERWQELPAWTATGDAQKRREVIDEFMLADGPGFLVVNSAMVRSKEEIKRCKAHEEKATKHQMRTCDDCEVERTHPYKELYNITWTTVYVDEAHKQALRNPRSLTYEGMDALHAEKRMCASGTPMGGKTLNLWPILHWLDAYEFPSKWGWADEWLEVSELQVGRTKKVKQIGDLSTDREAEFYRFHAPYLLRRTKQEVLPWLPDKDRIPLWCEMTLNQADQYKQWELDAELRIDEYRLSATSILDEYMRLKQFAFSFCGMDAAGSILPTTDSGKLLVVKDKLDELGLYDGSGEQVVIFTQFTSVAQVVHQWLLKDKVRSELITGAVTGNVRGLRDNRGRTVSKRAHIQRQFQSGDLQVVVINTHAGGVSINLDRASTAFFLDETWDPDDQEQAEDRVQRGTTLHQVTCYYVRSEDSIDVDIKAMNDAKIVVNARTLDQLRQTKLSRTRA